jgi:mRNA interferase RelE/StbE
MYALFETAEFSKSINRLSGKDAAFVAKKLREYIYPQLRQEPHFGTNIKKLRGCVPDTWRYRLGRYRIFYCIVDAEKTIFLLTVDQRKDAYRQL